MLKVKELHTNGYEKVIEAIDLDAKLHCIIAIHNTTLGPSLGGTRIYPYKSVSEALDDALRLSKGMTYKSAIAELGLGGGKSVIIADPRKDKNEKLLAAFAEAVDSLHGMYICAEDVGTDTEDMLVISKYTPYVAALPTRQSSGDPSPFTAWGIFRGMQAVGLRAWNSLSLRGKTICIQGLGKVGFKLADFLFWHGARLFVSDIDEEKVKQAIKYYGAQRVNPENVYSTPCDIFVPCAMGGIVNDETIDQFRCRAIAGSANNQLLHSKHGLALLEKKILYAPDFVINSGGIINASIEFEPERYNPVLARQKVDHIFETLLEIFNRSHMQKRSTSEIAIELAEYKISSKIGKRKGALFFHNDLKPAA
jgi:leucine dehydrogenase